DIMKIAMIKVYDEMKTKKLKSRLILQVHDELVIEASIDEIEEVKSILLHNMRDSFELSVPLEVDLSQQDSLLKG
ncbi:MAG: DNA polymerase, partial [Clostridia bacterium]|nr:DNA polymerase [Clostridia bacterium]